MAWHSFGWRRFTWHRFVSWAGLAIACGGLVLGCSVLTPTEPEAPATPHLLFGNPSEAVPSPHHENNYLIVRSQYAMSYNREKGIANWVSWQLNRDWLGSEPRSEFMPDTSLPTGWYQVTTNDYTGSGFDRGHLVPAADRNRTRTDSQAVFLMTNIIPQAPDNNQGPWERLESYCRDLVRQGKELYIIAGSSEVGGVGSRGSRDRIGNDRITVPALTWKIVVVLDRPGMTLADVTNDTRVIAVIMPNQQGIRETSWQSYRRSVDLIEQVTGYNFLSELPVGIQAVLETQTDTQ
ncbi:DNA/RNA non-specific endonuclease [Leptolyngbya sp. AN02str]|uniref:DNA/RNA non-specific endonuclease n=1 Tax=Leptolyngbya sp. AN02str TaxID=3423363 RepID=UPI003D323518